LSEIIIEEKQQNMDRSIVLALEQVSQVFRTLLWDYSKQKKLSPIQIQFLVYIDGHSKKYSSVSEMARAFNLTAATVSDAVKSLERKGLVQKIVSRRDGRKFPISLTKEGFSMASHLANWYGLLLDHIQNFPSETREAVLIFLLKLIESLKQDQLLEEIKTCLSCRYFVGQMESNFEQTSYCLLRKVPLNISELRLNCPNFNAAIV
jgi:DNA-binding MarR family transcriptional regulator